MHNLVKWACYLRWYLFTGFGRLKIDFRDLNSTWHAPYFHVLFKFKKWYFSYIDWAIFVLFLTFYEHCWLYTLPSVHIGKLAHGRVTPGEDLRPRRKFCQDWVINNLTLQTDLTSRILPLQTWPTFISRAGLLERRFTPFSMSSGPIGLTARAHGTNSHPVFLSFIKLYACVSSFSNFA